MVKRFKLNPVLCAAFGAVIGFYFLAPLYLREWLFVLMLVPLAVLCIFRVLSSVVFSVIIFLIFSTTP